MTHLEDPGLVEIAVGVDTTARWQTAWQVRLLPVPTGSTCTTDDEDLGDDWLDLIRPSDGRLTADTIEVEDDDDPCELPPGGGYRGLENQTYRVEIHEGGAPGTATFKWSRENASVVLPVVEMVSTTVLRLASVGKDDVLRISTDDWVEILDDNAELDGEPGAMRKVTVDDAERTITFTGALPASLQPADADAAAASHLRVVRWDQSGVVRDGTRRRDRRRGRGRRPDHRPGLRRPRRSSSSTASSSRSRSPRTAAASAAATTGSSPRARRHVDSTTSRRRRRTASTTTTRASASSRSRTARRAAAACGRRCRSRAARAATAPSASRRSRTPRAR